MKEILDLKIYDSRTGIISFEDWQKEAIEYLDEHPNIKKVWIVNEQRHTGGTYFSKLLMFFRKPCTENYVITNNLGWSKYISRQRPINFHTGIHNKDSVWYRASNFLKPVTLFGLEKDIEEHKQFEALCNSDKLLASITTPINKIGFECLYDNEFKSSVYETLCSYNFNFFIINLRPQDIDKARPYIEADMDKEDVLIINVKEPLKIYKEWFEHQKQINIEKGE